MKEKEKEKETINELIWKLKEAGGKIKNIKEKENLAKSINDFGFRLLEQTRLGNKENVYYMLLRCFHANKQEFPIELVEAFKPENEKYFKTLIFSFLAPILGKEDKEAIKSQETQRETEGGEA
jgi:CRISPR-associated protein Cst1